MIHADNQGLVLPPRVASVQVRVTSCCVKEILPVGKKAFHRATILKPCKKKKNQTNKLSNYSKCRWSNEPMITQSRCVQPALSAGKDVQFSTGFAFATDWPRMWYHIFLPNHWSWRWKTQEMTKLLSSLLENCFICEGTRNLKSITLWFKAEWLVCLVNERRKCLFFSTTGCDNSLWFDSISSWSWEGQTVIQVQGIGRKIKKCWRPCERRLQG